MFVVSFYSFKGGVGRTVALLNTAWHLASRGSRVALLDLDLEAPGLQSARLRCAPKESRTRWSPPVPRKGLCDLVVQFAANQAIEEWPGGYLTEGLGPEGRMALIAARGEREGLSIGEYERFVQTFSWARFYRDMNGRGFMEGLIAALTDRGYDYLFIDARTGLTDVAGITLLHLPDLVVLITNLSDQSVQGIKTQLDTIRAVNQECTPDGEGSRRRREGREKTPISVLLVGSTLPRGELKARQQRLSTVESTLHRSLDILIDYLPLLALEEENHILAQSLEGGRDEMLLGSNRPYERLVEEIVARNPAAPENLLVVGEELNQIGRWREALAHFDEVQDRYGEHQRGILWEAKLHKMKAQVQALDARAAEQSLDWLEQHQQGRERNRWEEAAQIVRGRLALSRAYVTLNQFEEARTQAQRALWLLQESRRLHRGHEHKSLKAACRFSLGQTYGLCGAWEEACATLQMAADSYKALGTRPLLECLAFAELARARLLTDQPLVAQETLEWARMRAGLTEQKTSVGQNAQQPRSSGRIASTYVQGRLLQAEAEILCEQGRGRSAIEALLKAFHHFQRDGDGVGLVEVATSLAAFDLSLPKLDDTASEDPLARWREAANRLGMQRIAVRLDLLKSMRSLAQPPSPQTFRRRLLSEQLVDDTLRWTLLLERSRQLLSQGYPLSKIRNILVQIRNESNNSKRQREIEHELSLLEALVEIARNDDEPKQLDSLVAYAESLNSRSLRTREAQARFVIALGDTQSDRARSALKTSLTHLEDPDQWLWNLPIAFVRHSEYFKSRWSSLELLRENAWPVPRKSESRPVSKSSRARSKSRGSSARPRAQRTAPE